MNESFDIAIIGAGPAGLSAARTIAQSDPGISVLLVDAVKPWEKPVACAEGVGSPGFHEAIGAPPPHWVRMEINRAIFHSPDNTTIPYTDRNKGYIINRTLMHKEMWEWCAHNGIDTRAHVSVASISPPDEKGVRLLFFKEHTAVRAKVIIDCSGPLSRLGRDQKIDWKADDLEVACFVHIEGVSYESDAVHLFVGRDFAPGGYGWAFPRDEKSVNVGLLVGSNHRGRCNITNLLSGFIRRNFPGGSIGKLYAGAIPCCAGRRKLAIDGMLKAGDAASTVNPISRAGIVEAMISGSLAGKYGMAMLKTRSPREIAKICREYEKAWREKRGKNHERLARVKHALEKIPDADYNSAARALAAVDHTKLTMAQIFRLSLGRFPRLVWAMRHLM